MADSTQVTHVDLAQDHEAALMFWNGHAEAWKQHVGLDGDANRRLNSDPVLWRMLGDVRGRTILDAGCGTGYLATKLVTLGGASKVVGIDFSPEMIRVCKESSPLPEDLLEFRVDSCSTLASIPDDNTFDALVSNYVLMDVADFRSAIRHFFRVLKPGGIAVVIFSHPCFPLPDVPSIQGQPCMLMPFPYFEERTLALPSWNQELFRGSFVAFHRPLSAYWQTFTTVGFHILELDEPHYEDTPEHRSFQIPSDAPQLDRLHRRPYSIAFKLLKPNNN